jgi:putative nucleotidyltransferase with HDIG domain
MTRDEALAFVRGKVPNENLVKHMIATEAVMRALARRLSLDPEQAGLAGLLHDCDLGVTEGDFSRHGVAGAAMLREIGVDEAICRAVEAHACHEGRRPETTMERALVAADQVTGLVIAAALVHPDKRISALQASSLKKRMKEKRFAAGVDRDSIRSCEALGVPLDEFLGLAISAMAGVAGELGL